MLKPRDHRTSAVNKNLASIMVRLFNPVSGNYLHLSASGETGDFSLSWLGFKHQAETLRKQAENRGEDWPFKIIRRDVSDPELPSLNEDLLY